MHQDPVRVGQIHWSRVFPLLRLFEAASWGTGLTVLVLAGAGLVVSWTGSALLNRMLSDGTITAVCEFPWPEYGRFDGTATADLCVRESWLTTQTLPSAVGNLFVSATRVCLGHRTVVPWTSQPPVPSASWILSADLMVWNAVVLCFLVPAVARVTATGFCCRDRVGMVDAIRLAAESLRHSLLSTGLMLLFLAVFRGLLALADLAARWGTAGSLLVSCLWGGLLLTAIVLAVMLVLGGIAWLLSLAAIGTDRCSGAEAEL